MFFIYSAFFFACAGYKQPINFLQECKNTLFYYLKMTASHSVTVQRDFTFFALDRKFRKK